MLAAHGWAFATLACKHTVGPLGPMHLQIAAENEIHGKLSRLSPTPLY